MAKILGSLAILGTIGLGVLWFFGLLYNWLWLGVVNSGSLELVFIYTVLFVLFLVFTIPIIVILGILLYASLVIFFD